MAVSYWAHVENGVVVNVSVGTDPVDAAWLSLVRATFESVVDITALDPQPGLGWTYADGTFTPPADPVEP